MSVEETVNKVLEACEGMSIPITTNVKLQAMETNAMEEIYTEMGKFSGVYIYHEGENVKYIGKAKPLTGRAKCHYQESIFPEGEFKEEGGNMTPIKGLKGDWKKGLYPAYFRDHLEECNITLSWVVVVDEQMRVAVEALLTQLLKPEFKEFQRITFYTRPEHKNYMGMKKVDLVQFAKDKGVKNPTGTKQKICAEIEVLHP